MLSCAAKVYCPCGAEEGDYDEDGIAGYKAGGWFPSGDVDEGHVVAALCCSGWKNGCFPLV